MSKPRKRYRQKPVNPNVLALASIGQSKLTPEDQEERIAPARIGLEQITKGQASQADWQSIFDVINMLDRFVKMPTVMRHGQDYLNTMQGVVVKILDRQKATGTKALYPGELEDLRGLVELWADLLSTVTHREYSLAEERAHARLVSVLRSRKPVPGVRVCEA